MQQRSEHLPASNQLIRSDKIVLLATEDIQQQAAVGVLDRLVMNVIAAFKGVVCGQCSCCNILGSVRSDATKWLHVRCHRYCHRGLHFNGQLIGRKRMAVPEVDLHVNDFRVQRFACKIRSKKES